MSDAVKVGFVPFSAASRGILVVFCDDALKLGAASLKALGTAANTIKRAAAANQFKGKSGSVLDILAPEGIKAQRLIVVGAGKPSDLKEKDFLKFGGVIAGRLNAASDAVTIAAELPDGTMQPDQAAAIASGIRLRAYRFDRYKTKKKDGENGGLRADISIAVGDVPAAKKAFAPESHVVDGVIIARELVNEPPNVLFPIEFARRASQLRKLGVDVDVLDVKAMTKLGMGALLGVGQGSTQPSRMVVMRWNGGKKGDQVSPVSIASVSQKDVPLEISVIGNVEAYSAVTVRSQVGGELIKVHFKEGDYVKAGDLLFSIDKRQVEAQLSQAQANFAKAKASLEQAKANLARDIAQPYIQMTAQELELPETDIDVWHPKVAAALGQADAKGQPAPMSLTDYQGALRADPAWKKTQGAQDQAMQVGSQVLQSMGLVV